MSSRFLALMGDAERLASLRADLAGIRGMSLHEVAPDLFVVTNSDLKLHHLADQSGVVLGTLFHRYGASREVETLPIPDADAVAKTRGRFLLDRYWGRYLAVLRSGDGLLAFRDPTGMFPCVYVEGEGLIALASEPSLIAALGLIEPEVDTLAVARSLLLCGLPEENTALRGIRRLLPGTRLERYDRLTTTVATWSPWNYESQDSVNSVEEQAEKLRRISQHCIAAWSNKYDHGLLGLSGGLDSSIVAVGLVKAGNHLSGLTLITDDPLGDERRYCDIVTQHLGLPIFSEKYDLAEIDLDRSSVAHLPTPFGRMDSMAYDAALTKIGRQVQANAIFSGNGGDNVFYLSRSARALADRIMAEGLSLGALETAQDICRLTGTNIFSVAKHAVQAWRAASAGYDWQIDRTFLSQSIATDKILCAVNHPWLSAPCGRNLPGKAAHIAMIVRMQHSLDAYYERGGTEVIHPLVSQPILEFCLGIPTWYQCEGGRDRSVARRAYARELPAKIIERRGKGSPQGFIYQIFYRYRAEIRERIMDGFLGGAGLIDRRAVEATLRSDHRLTDAEVLRLMLFVDTEAWIRHWRLRNVHAGEGLNGARTA